MKMQLTTVNQWVHDQDEALEFYTEKLGMELRDGRDHARDGRLPLAHRRPGRPAGHRRRPDGDSRPARVRARDDGPAAGPRGEGCLRRPLLPDRRHPGDLRGAQGQGRRVHAGADAAAVRHRRRVPRPLGQPHPGHAGRHRARFVREGSARGGALPRRQSTESRSTTNTSGSCGAITPPAPRAPYAIADGIVSLRRPPTLMPWTPASQPGITWPLPSLKRERLAAIPGGVELLAGPERDARVMHRDVVAARRLLTVADDDVLDPELERDVAFRLVDLGALQCHGESLCPGLRRPQRPPEEGVTGNRGSRLPDPREARQQTVS